MAKKFVKNFGKNQAFKEHLAMFACSALFSVICIGVNPSLIAYIKNLEIFLSKKGITFNYQTIC